MGAARLPFAMAKGASRSHTWKLVSVDVFGTLVARIGDEHAAWRDGAERVMEAALQHGESASSDALELRRKIEQQLSSSLLSSGKDPEFPHHRAIEGMLAELKIPDASPLAATIADGELEREIANTTSVPSMMESVQQWTREGKRVIAVSDTRYTAQELATLLDRHGITAISSIYSSADHAASKFSGRLFDIVSAQEGVPETDILHIGDDLFTDALSPAQRGLAVRRVRRTEIAQLPSAIAEPRTEDSAFRFGYRRLGPILVAFTRLLIDQAQRDGTKRLNFVARDGELLLRVAQALVAEPAGSLELNYLHLSRRAMASLNPDLQNLCSDPSAADRIVASLRNIREFGSAIDTFNNYYGIPPELVDRHLKRLNRKGELSSDLRTLLGDHEAAADIANSLKAGRDRLKRFLIQERVLDENSALVDIGWKGSLQLLLESETRDWGLPSPRGYYLGLWNEGGRTFPSDAYGLIGDQRRGRGPMESSAWHAAFLLEAVCRARHGMVVGFEESEHGRLLPIHMEQGATRVAERNSEAIQSRLQEGIIAYARWFASSVPISTSNPSTLRREAQRAMYKLAFFPSPSEIEIGKQLTYSEPTSDESAMPLILSADSNNKAGGFAGLRSPWKGGFMRMKLGPIGAFAYCLSETAISLLPRGSKPAIRRLLIRAK